MAKLIKFLVLIHALLSSVVVSVEMDGENENSFVRIAKLGSNREVQFASKTYVSENGLVRIVLLAAAHIGEKTYFEYHQNMLKNSDAVLYEGGEKSTVKTYLESRAYRESAQKIMADAFGLCCQLEALDYEQENFIWADNIVYCIENQGFPSDSQIARNKNQYQKMGLEALSETIYKPRKPIHADSIDFHEQMLGRNEIVYTKCREKINNGKSNIIIYYGAAHMPAIEEHIMQNYGVRFESSEWLTAWHYKQSWTNYAQEMISYAFSRLIFRVPD